MRLEDMTKTQLLNIILRKDDVETRLRAEIATLKEENKRIGRVRWAKTVGICLLFAVICIATFTLVSCSTSEQMIEEKDEMVTWPEYLRDWATDYEINDASRLAIIDRIDTLYRLANDSTVNHSLLRDKLCQLQGPINDAIRNDTSFVFSLMMRATARNIYGLIWRNPWLIDEERSCILDYLFMDSQWWTRSEDDIDFMYMTFFDLSWQANRQFANLILLKEDGKAVEAKLVVRNGIDTTINDLQIMLEDSEGTIVDTLMLNDDFYEDTSNYDEGTKAYLLSPYQVMGSMISKLSMIITYETANDTVTMTGFPHVYFFEQVEGCPRMKRELTRE